MPANPIYTAFHAAPIELKFAAQEIAGGCFSGFASTYGGEPDSYGDVIAPGAFTESLAAHAKAGTRPALLWQHDQRCPIGIWTGFDDSDEGLLSHGQLTLEVPQAKAAHALMKDGALALSIGFNIPMGGAHTADYGRVISKIDLMEISLVAIPANVNAKITDVKCFDPSSPNPREFERSVRDALGLSAREAKRLMAGGWSGLVRDEQSDDSEELAAIAATIQNITAALKSR
ncbi:prohead protease [Pseudomonas sp. J237]|nr:MULTISPECIES: HK97 family phage prohead protease [Pseudomonas]OEO23094.1 prohead protease [Pseudomonas sp. J237]